MNDFLMGLEPFVIVIAMLCFVTSAVLVVYAFSQPREARYDHRLDQLRDSTEGAVRSDRTHIPYGQLTEDYAPAPVSRDQEHRGTSIR